VTPSYACRPSLYILWALYLSVKENLGNLAPGFAGGGFSALWRHGNGMMADGDRAEDKQKDERRGRRRGPAQNISAADPPVGAGAWLCHCECARKCTSTPRGIPVRHACCQHCSRFLIQKKEKKEKKKKHCFLEQEPAKCSHFSGVKTCRIGLDWSEAPGAAWHVTATTSMNDDEGSLSSLARTDYYYVVSPSLTDSLSV